MVDPYLLALKAGDRGSFCDVFGSVLATTNASRIRLITSSKVGYGEQVKALRKIQDARNGPPRREDFLIEVRLLGSTRSASLLPHDRFAVIDDELWHWGANVGGTHCEVHAYSRGWSATQTRAAAYFDRLWRDTEAVR
jgi:hypothetical protein